MRKILVIVMLIFAFGCSDDATEPSENTIVGKWMKDVTKKDDSEINILVIEFTEDGKYIVQNGKAIEDEYILIGSYTYTNDILTMSDEKCEDMDGKYKLEYRNNGVDFIIVEDECDRNEFIPGFFDKYKATLYNK